MKYFIFFLFIQIISFQCFSQQINKTISGQQFSLNSGEWKKVGTNGKLYSLDNEVITVKFKASQVQDFFSRHGLSVIRRSANGYYDLRVPRNFSIIELMEKISAETELVEIVEANTIGHYGFTPNDPQFLNQWHLAKIGMPAAWDKIKGNSSVQVAIIDSGLEIAHEDIGKGVDAYDNLWKNNGEDQWADPSNPATGNGVDNDGNGLIDDWRGWDFVSLNNDVRSPNTDHGTIVSGLVSAKLHNNRGVSGIGGGNNSRGLELMMLGVGKTGPSSAALDDAILYAVQMGADVIQMSLDVAQTTAIDNAIQTAVNNGIPVVCASGNHLQGAISVVTYPATNPNVIAVGATDVNDVRAFFSNFGPELFISAPGDQIVSTQLNNTYNQASGTSFAAPIVSAVIGLLRCINQNLTIQQIKDILSSTSAKVGSENYNYNPTRPGHSLGLGYGRINADAALTAALPVIAGLSTVCTSAPYTVNNPQGTTVSWSTSDPSGLSIDANTGIATRINNFIGNTTIIAKITKPGNFSYEVKKATYVLGIPIASSTTLIYPSGQRGIDPVTLCASCTYNFLVDLVPNASSYTWLLPQGFSFVSGKNTSTPGIKTSATSGTYTLYCQVNNSCGSSFTNSLGINISGGGGQQQRVVVYPNPSSSSLTIESTGSSIGISDTNSNGSTMTNTVDYYFSAKLLDQFNVELLSGESQNGKILMDVNNVQNGLYYLQIRTKQQLIVKQIVVSK